MNSHLKILAILACAVVVMALRLKRADDNDNVDTLDLTPGNGTKACKTKDDRDGICINEGQCSADHVVLLGGDIDDSEIRAGSCPGQMDWCCVLTDKFGDTDIPTRADLPKTQGCRIAEDNKCPWCVAVYRDGGNRLTMSPTGLFCGGVVIGSQLVLTSATCLLSCRKQNIWVKLPGSARSYNVSSRLKHPQYNSGTREHDIAILVLSESISWEGDQAGKGACLGLRTPLEGQCVSAGFDRSDQLVLSQLSVKTGSCSKQGSTYDAACGSNADECLVTSGSPVLCSVNNIGQLVVGIARQGCNGGKTVLGSLVQSADWLQGEFTKNGLQAGNFTVIWT